MSVPVCETRKKDEDLFCLVFRPVPASEISTGSHCINIARHYFSFRLQSRPSRSLEMVAQSQTAQVRRGTLVTQPRETRDTTF